MTIPTSTAPRASDRGSARPDPSRFAGIAFLMFFLAGSTLVVSGPSIYENGSLEQYAAAHADSGLATRRSLAAFVLLPAAAVSLVWAVSHMSAVLARTSVAMSAAARAGGWGAAAFAIGLTMAGAAESAAAHVAGGTGAGFPADPETGYVLSMLASQVQAATGWAATVVLFGIGMAARRANALPGWLLWTGFLAAPLVAISWVLFTLPLLGFVLWVAAACFLVDTGQRDA